MITLRVPTSADAIPIQTYLAYQQAEDDLERVHVITGMSSGQIKGLKLETVDKIKSMFEDAVNTSEGKFERTITIDGVKLGFIPDLTAMSLGEYIDLDEYGKLLYKDKKLNAEVLMKVMAVLYRPVKMQIGKTYEIVPYDSNKVYQYIEQIGKLTMATCHGVLLFFLDFRKGTVDQFPRVFNAGTEQDDEGDELVKEATPDGLSAYGWLHIIESLSDRDVTKWDAVLNKGCYEIFTHLTYMKDFAQVQAQEIKKAYRQ